MKKRAPRVPRSDTIFNRLLRSLIGAVGTGVSLVQPPKDRPPTEPVARVDETDAEKAQKSFRKSPERAALVAAAYADVMASLASRPMPRRDWKSWREQTLTDWKGRQISSKPPTREEWNDAMRGR